MQISLEYFEAWLMSQPKDREFKYMEGSSGAPTGCVFCNYLRECTSARGFVVCGHGVFSSGRFVDFEAKLNAFSRALARPGPLTAADAQREYLKLFPSPELVSETVQLLDHGVFETKEGVL